MNKRIVYKNPDGSCGILIPAPQAQLSHETDQDFLQRVAEKDVPQGLSWRIVDINLIPEDRTFRDAWTDGNPTETIDVDMGKAREIHMNSIREARNQALASLDIETLKGKDVQVEKQRLRDIPQDFDLSSAETPEQLNELWPDELNKPQ